MISLCFCFLGGFFPAGDLVVVVVVVVVVVLVVVVVVVVVVVEHVVRASLLFDAGFSEHPAVENVARGDAFTEQCSVELGAGNLHFLAQKS